MKVGVEERLDALVDRRQSLGQPSVQLALARENRLDVWPADPGAERLSFNAPLARALMGAEEGDVVTFNGREAEILRVGS